METAFVMDPGTLNENIKLKASVEAYNGRYGPEDYKGIVLNATIRCDEESQTPKNKELIFVVDLSGSMSESISTLRGSLRAFRDSLIGRDPKTDCRSNEDVEQEFCKTANIRLIGYSETAWEIYPKIDKNNAKCTWDDMIEHEIRSHGITNMGAGIELAFSLSDPERCTWIVVMTDGISNHGKYQCRESFQRLRDMAPNNTRIVTLGYGKSFNTKVLTIMGEFTYIETKEQIPMVFGSIANELKHTWGFGAYWKMTGNVPIYKYIIGSPKFGCLYQQREFTTGIIPKCPEDSFDFMKWLTTEQPLNLKFILVQNMKEVSIPFSVNILRTSPSEKFREKYYASAKGRRLNILYNVSHRHVVNPSEIMNVCKEIRYSIDKWTEDCSLLHKEELLRMIEDMESLSQSGGHQSEYKTIGYAAAARTVDCTLQTSNTVEREYTASQRQSVESCLDSSSAYY